MKNNSKNIISNTIPIPQQPKKDILSYRDFVSKYRKEGKTLNEISDLWKEYKSGSKKITVNTLDRSIYKQPKKRNISYPKEDTTNSSKYISEPEAAEIIKEKTVKKLNKVANENKKMKEKGKKLEESRKYKLLGEQKLERAHQVDRIIRDLKSEEEFYRRLNSVKNNPILYKSELENEYNRRVLAGEYDKAFDIKKTLNIIKDLDKKNLSDTIPYINNEVQNAFVQNMLKIHSPGAHFIQTQTSPEDYVQKIVTTGSEDKSIEEAKKSVEEAEVLETKDLLFGKKDNYKNEEEEYEDEDEEELSIFNNLPQGLKNIPISQIKLDTMLAPREISTLSTIKDREEKKEYMPNNDTYEQLYDPNDEDIDELQTDFDLLSKRYTSDLPEIEENTQISQDENLQSENDLQSSPSLNFYDNNNDESTISLESNDDEKNIEINDEKVTKIKNIRGYRTDNNGNIKETPVDIYYVTKHGEYSGIEDDTGYKNFSEIKAIEYEDYEYDFHYFKSGVPLYKIDYIDNLFFEKNPVSEKIYFDLEKIFDNIKKGIGMNHQSQKLSKLINFLKKNFKGFYNNGYAKYAVTNVYISIYDDNGIENNKEITSSTAYLLESLENGKLDDYEYQDPVFDGRSYIIMRGVYGKTPNKIIRTDYDLKENKGKIYVVDNFDFIDKIKYSGEMIIIDKKGSYKVSQWLMGEQKGEIDKRQSGLLNTITTILKPETKNIDYEAIKEFEKNYIKYTKEYTTDNKYPSEIKLIGGIIGVGFSDISSDSDDSDDDYIFISGGYFDGSHRGQPGVEIRRYNNESKQQDNNRTYFQGASSVSQGYYPSYGSHQLNSTNPAEMMRKLLLSYKKGVIKNIY